MIRDQLCFNGARVLPMLLISFPQRLPGTYWQNGVRRPPPKGPCWRHRVCHLGCDCRRLGSTLASCRWQDTNVGNPLWRRALLLNSGGSGLEKGTQEFCVTKGGHCSFLWFHCGVTQGVTADSLGFTVVGEGTALKTLKTIGRDKASGLDTLPAKFIIDGAAEIAGPLIHIVTMSILHSTVPKELESPRVVPLHEKDSKNQSG